MAAQQKTESGAAPETNDATQTPVFTSFAATIAQLLESAPMDDIATPKLADAMADAITRYWRCGVATGDIDLTQPLYLLDLAADEGKLAWLLGRALQQRIAGRDASEMPSQPPPPHARDLPYCFVACCPTVESADTLLAHPYLAPMAQTGKLDATVLPQDGQAGITLRRQGISLLQLTNPLIILSLGYFSRLAPELLAAHHGKLMLGETALETDGQLRYRWSDLAADAPCIATDADLLAWYQHHVASAAVPLPAAALSVLHRLQHRAGQRYLLLACDRGVAEPSAIRLGALYPPAQWQAGVSHLPLNYHALSWTQRRQGAWVWNRQLEQGGLLLHAAWADANGRQDRDCFDAMLSALEAAHPADSAQCVQLAQHLAAGEIKPSGPSCLSILRASGYDPAVLKPLLPHLMQAIAGQSRRAQLEWQEALERAWCNGLPGMQCDGIYYDIAMFAIELGQYGLARAVLGQTVAWYGDDANDHYLLAWCEAATGESRQARTRAALALQMNSAHAGAKELLSTLEARLARCRELAWYCEECARDGELVLEPLAEQHIPDLFRQSRDPQICLLTRLPEWRTPDELRKWMGEQDNEAGRCSYAVMHADHGALGVVSCHVAGGSGYFYYWIGCDFQHRGFGERAGRLCLAQMARFGLEDIYTSVAHCNRHSQHLLGKLGFTRMEIALTAPEDEQYFFHHGQEKDGMRTQAGLLTLCEAIGYPVCLDDSVNEI